MVTGMHTLQTVLTQKPHGMKTNNTEITSIWYLVMMQQEHLHKGLLIVATSQMFIHSMNPELCECTSTCHS